MQNKTTAYLLLFLLLGLLSFYFYNETITWFPSFTHAWTQSDRFALALAYLKNGLDFFHPQTFNLMTKEGITGVDLPWHEYIVALLMKISGNESPWIFRLYTLLYCMVGYFFLFRLSFLFSPSKLKAYTLVLFTFTMPVLVYYQAGFVPSSPALATLFIGLYFYFKYQQSESYKHLWLSLAFLTLAALYRSPFNIFLFATLLQQMLKAVQLKKANRTEALGYFIAFGSIICSHFYKTYLKQEYGSMFLTQIRPPADLGQLRDILFRVKQNWQLDYLTGPHYILISITTLALIIFLLKRQGCDRSRTILSQQVLLTLGGAAVYFLLMAKQFPDHDYYIIDSFYPGVVLLLLLGLSVIPLDKGWRRWGAYPILIGLLSLAAIKSKRVQDERYTFNFWDRGEITRQNFEGSAVFLDELGIGRSALILVLDAYSTNAPLILMDRRGYTVQHTLKEKLKEGLENDFDYVVIQDVFLPSEVILNYPELTDHLKRIGGNGQITVFEYSKTNLNQNVADVLGIADGAPEYQLNFETDSVLGWEHNLIIVDTVAFEGKAGFMASSQLFGPVFNFKNVGFPAKVLFEGRFKQQKSWVGFEVVLSAVHEGAQTFYRSFPVNLSTFEAWKKYSCLFSLPEDLPAEAEVKCNIYNPGGAAVWMDNISVTLY